MSKRDPWAALRRGFDIRKKFGPRIWGTILRCRICNTKWSYPFDRSRNPSGGTILHLLNHEAEHKELR